MGRALPIGFYSREAADVARDLVGRTLARRQPDGSLLRARITETEAYAGPHDLACHAAKGRTRRTEAMFGPPGRAYVYFIYGMHNMLNVVTGRSHPESPRGQAVLVRSAEALDGWDANLVGPGRLARSFAVDKTLYGHDLRQKPLWLEAGRPAQQVVATRRIGVDYAGPWAKAPLRFVDGESDAVCRLR